MACSGLINSRLQIVKRTHEPFDGDDWLFEKKRRLPQRSFCLLELILSGRL
jgi:hypothetical protein